jgi:hypothetical protein
MIAFASITLLSASSVFPFNRVLPSSKIGYDSKNGMLIAFALLRLL